MMKTAKYGSAVTSIALGLLGGLIAFGLFAWFGPNNNIGDQLRIQQDQAYARLARFQGEGKTDFIAASSIATPAVVHIKTEVEAKTSRGGQRRNDVFPFPELFEDFGQRGPSQSSGSGVIISSDGYIVTNNHVIDGADKVQVVLNDNRTYTANIIGTDPSTDLALVKISESNLPTLKFGNSDKLQVGEWVLAVGNPFNLTSTVTAGIVSAKGRSLNILESKFKIESFIQTDAAVNPGNSGGALIDVNAQLMGINTAIASRTGSYSGYSFAVPANIVQKVVEDLMKFGTVQRGFLGVMIKDVDGELAAKENLKTARGAYITEVNKNSAAQDAGLEKGDVIIKIGDSEIASSSELTEQVGRHRPGDKLKVTVLRGSNRLEKEIVLKSSTGSTKLAESGDVETTDDLGAEMTTAKPADFEGMPTGITGGVKVQKIRDGKLRNAGVREGFIITHIDKIKVRTPGDVLKALENREGAVLIEGYYTGGKKGAYAIDY
jgi:serine protease Do